MREGDDEGNKNNDKKGNESARAGTEVARNEETRNVLKREEKKILE